MKYKTNYLNAKICSVRLITGLLFLLAFGIFIGLATEIVLKNNPGMDASVIKYVRANETESLIHFMIIFTFFGSAQFLLPVYTILILFYLFKKNKSYAIDIALTGIISTSILFLLKNIFKRHRPSLPIVKTIVGYSFPSGHSLSSFVFCSILGYLIFQSDLKIPVKYAISFLLILFTLTIGLSRIVLNVHYASDVLAGYCMGFVMVVVAFYIIKKARDINLKNINTLE